MIDECVTFMIAATQTTTMTVSNMLYYITRQHATLRPALQAELTRELKLTSFHSLTSSDWSKALLDSDLNWPLLSNTMVETLRIDPPQKTTSFL